MDKPDDGYHCEQQLSMVFGLTGCSPYEVGLIYYIILVIAVLRYENHTSCRGHATKIDAYIIFSQPVSINCTPTRSISNKRSTHVNCLIEREHTIQWRHNGRYGVSNHQPHDCLLNRLCMRRSIKENVKTPRHWPLCGNSPMTGEFPAQMASNAENVSIWWRHHDLYILRQHVI